MESPRDEQIPHAHEGMPDTRMMPQLPPTNTRIATENLRAEQSLPVHDQMPHAPTRTGQKGGDCPADLTFEPNPSPLTPRT